MSENTTRSLDAAAVPSVSSQFRLQFEQAQDSWVLLYPEGMVKLSESAGEILKRCNGENTIEQIISSLQDAFGETDLAADVMSFLDIALQQQWIETTEQA